jgi:tetratricopeptide (TPR) repeat protein
LESPPDDVARLVLRTVPSIEVPDSAEDALLTLTTLLRQGQDEVISKAFSQFEASIGPEDRRLIPALLAEINLGMTHRPVNADRVRRGIRMLQKYCPRDDLSAVYNIANGYAVIGEIQNARAMYTKVIRAKPEVSKDLLAQAWKNLGSLLEQDGDHQGARDCYARAVTLCPQLVEASMALAMAERDMGNLEKSLEYFGQVLTGNCPSEIALSTRGHRIEVLFRIGRFREAFEDIWVLIPDADKHTWILPWCARLVRANAESLGDMLPSALQFWDTCALRWPEDPLILEARLLCIGYAQMRGVSVPVDFQTYRDQVYAAIELELDIDESYLLDRVGHWAQADGDWDEASEHFRKAWEIEPERYGHCYGTSLNYLERFEEAHAVHRVQVESELATDQSWFQLAIASEGIGAIDECIMAYKMAIEVNPEYSLAWFNLGGVVWNSGDKIEATEIWKKAISRFPKDTLVSKVREFCPTLSTFDNGE